MRFESVVCCTNALRVVRRHLSLQIAFYIVSILAIAGPLRAEEPAGAKADGSSKLADSKPDPGEVTERQPPNKDKNHWFIGYGPANVHAKLKASEQRIDQQINKPLGALVPSWNAPRTFKDWNDEWRIWDLHAMVGRDLGPRFACFLDLGGSAGVVKNKDRYLLPLPFQSDIRFSRVMWFVSFGVDYYPCGKPDLTNVHVHNPILRCLLSAKPYVEATAGHVSEKQAATVGLTSGRLSATVRQDLHPSANYISPRIGVQIPLDADDSIKVQAGYLFFDKYADDCNNLSIYIFHQHKF